MASTIKVNNVQASDGGNIVNQCGTTITIGASGDTINLASGASQTGFGREGSVNWQTGSIKTGTFSPVSGEGYFVDTSAGVSTANLPAGSAGAIVSFSDYTRTFATYNLTLSPNGAEKIGGIAGDTILATNGQSATFVYVDGTEGWINTQETQTSATGLTGYIMASGGTETFSGNDKIHTFTGPGTFCVSAVSDTPACNQVSYIVVAGGAAGGTSQDGHQAGGGGAGGFREDESPITPYTSSPLDGAGNISVTASPYPIVVGGGGAAATCAKTKGGNGVDSSFSTITSTGGGGGGAGSNPGGCRQANAGGSGGGSGGSDQPSASGGAGNTPPTSPAQGKGGGSGASGPGAGGSGGGATGCGSQSPNAGTTHPGGAGVTTEITASPVVYSEGGPTLGTPGPGAAGPDNSGDGGQGALTTCSGGNGGSGVVIIRYKYQ